MPGTPSLSFASPKLPLAGKVAIVTGSSRGIGEAIVRRLAADGADVVVNYHGVDVCAEQVARGINAGDGGRAVVIKADVSTIEGGKHLLEESVRRFGVPDILVLNATVVGHRSLEDVDEEYFDLHLNTNVKGPLFLAQAAAKLMKPGSRIVFVSTSLTRATNILPMALVFALTKGAIEQIVPVLAKDLGKRRITVNAIAPGPVDTPIFRDGKTERVLRSIADQYPQRRIPPPDDITPLVAFLVGDDAGWINGQTIGVNGGLVV